MLLLTHRIYLCMHCSTREQDLHTHIAYFFYFPSCFLFLVSHLLLQTSKRRAHSQRAGDVRENGGHKPFISKVIFCVLSDYLPFLLITIVFPFYFCLVLLLLIFPFPKFLSLLVTLLFKF